MAFPDLPVIYLLIAVCIVGPILFVLFVYCFFKWHKKRNTLTWDYEKPTNSRKVWMSLTRWRNWYIWTAWRRKRLQKYKRAQEKLLREHNNLRANGRLFEPTHATKRTTGRSQANSAWFDGRRWQDLSHHYRQGKGYKDPSYLDYDLTYEWKESKATEKTAAKSSHSVAVGTSILDKKNTTALINTKGEKLPNSNLSGERYPQNKVQEKDPHRTQILQGTETGSIIPSGEEEIWSEDSKELFLGKHIKGEIAEPTSCLDETSTGNYKGYEFTQMPAKVNDHENQGTEISKTNETKLTQLTKNGDFYYPSPQLSLVQHPKTNNEVFIPKTHKSTHTLYLSGNPTTRAVNPNIPNSNEFVNSVEEKPVSTVSRFLSPAEENSKSYYPPPISPHLNRSIESFETTLISPPSIINTPQKRKEKTFPYLSSPVIQGLARQIAKSESTFPNQYQSSNKDDLLASGSTKVATIRDLFENDQLQKKQTAFKYTADKRRNVSSKDSIFKEMKNHYLFQRQSGDQS